MKNKKSQTPKSPALKNTRSNTTSLTPQLRRVAAYFLEFKTATTPELQEKCSAIHPPRRVCDLRHDFGWRIETHWQKYIDAQGKSHRVGRYVLMKIGVMP